MSIIALIIAASLILFALYLVQSFIPAPWKTPLLIVIVVVALVWILSLFVPSIANTHFGT